MYIADNQYCTFSLRSKKATGIIVNGKSSTNVKVKIVTFKKGSTYHSATVQNKIIKRHKIKHNVKIFPTGIIPRN